MKKISALLFIAILLSCSNKVLVQKIKKDDVVSGKLFYALPANTLDFEIKIKEESYKRGALFKAYANDCETYLKVAVDSLGLEKTALEILKEKDNYANYTIIEEDFNWSQGAIPDTSKIFVFRNEPKFYKDNTLTLAFNHDWLVSSGSIATENKTFEIISTFVSTSLSVATSIAKSGTIPKKEASLENICGGKLKNLIKLKKELDNFQLNPPPNLNAEALQMSKAARLKLIEKEIEMLFYTKKETTKIVRFSIYLSDRFNKAKGLALFKLNPNTGVLHVNEDVFSDMIWPLNNPKQIEKTKISVSESASYYSITTMPEKYSVLEVLSQKSMPSLNVNQYYGIVYNVPLNMRFYLRNGEEKIIKMTRFSIAQFGYVNTLDQRLTKADFTLDSLTGRLVKATLESKAWITSDRIKNGGALLPQADSTLKKKPKPTELEKMQEEVKEKELRVKLKELDAKLQ